MSLALQMPVRREAAEKVGTRLFRKHVLPIGRIQHEGKTLDFNRGYLESLVHSFKERAFDQVPFVLADAGNRHNEDPERFRGEVRDVELASNGLHVLVEMSDRGAQLLEENPRLGVSARIVEGLKQSDGRIFDRALRHVCATMDPVVTGLQDWEPLSIRSLSQSSDQHEVLNLTAATYTMLPLTTDQIKKLNELPEDQRKALEAILEPKAPQADAKDDGKQKTEPTEPADSKLRQAFKRMLGLKEDKDVDSTVGLLLEGDEGDKPTTTTAAEPAASSLSKEERDAIDLANTRAASAERAAIDLSVQLAEANWNLERKTYESAGVPPALLDLAQPVMTAGAKTVDLSNGEKVDPQDLMRKMLDEAKGTVDLSTVGSSKDKELEDEAHKLASDSKAWGAE